MRFVRSWGAALLAGLWLAGAQAQTPSEEGRKLFLGGAVPACALCHMLKHAGATGQVGPDLDELRPDADRVEKALRNGIGPMPAFKSLTDEQIRTLALYVATATGAAR